MNDNEPDGDHDVPEWAWAIIEKHDLGVRADSPLSAAIALVMDAADNTREAGLQAFQEQALTSDTMRRLAEVVALIEDAMELSALCPQKPETGMVTKAEDGLLTWSPPIPSHDG